MKTKQSGLLIGLLTLLIPSMATAANASGGVAASPAATASSVSQASSQEFSIADGAPLSVALLDSCWQNREDLTNQQIIASYLMTQPSVPQDYEIAWKTARLVYFIGNYGTGENRFVNSGDGVTLFNYGVTAGKIAKQLKPNRVEGNYWYAIDLGSYGLAKGILSSASNAKYGMAALKVSISIDPSYQNYGGSRILGRYYQELPGIFGGDADKAYKLISSAVKNAPTFSNNWVFLGQFYLSGGQYANALTSCQKALNMPAQDGKYEELRYKKEAKQCIAKAQAKLS